MSDKTEPPSSKKLRDARKKGQVVQSKELASSALIITAFGFLFAMGGTYVTLISKMILLPPTVIGPNFDFEGTYMSVMLGVFFYFVQMTVPLLLIIAVVGVLSHFFQYGLLFTMETAKPDLKKLNPGKAIKKIFSVKNLFELVKSVVKILFLGLVIFLVIRNGLPDMLRIPYCGLGCILPVLGDMMRTLAINTGFAFIIIGAADYVFQRFQFMKQMKMSKEEVKQEYKEMEGNPEIKGRRRQLAHELLNQSVQQSVKKSTVVVTNPTHIAIALEYEEGKTQLPIVRAKGENFMAKRIIEIAEEEGIPVMQNVPLAHALNEQSKIDQYIPVELIEAVAEVLRWVKRMDLEGQ